MFVGSLWVTPIGVGAGYGRAGELQSSYLVGAGTTRLCMDLGAGAFNALRARIDPEELDAIVISHLHADHCVDLFALRVYLLWGPAKGRRVRLIGPEGLRSHLSGFAGEEGWDDAFSFEVIDPSADPIEVGDAKLSFREVPHSTTTYAIRVDHAGKAITYGADCRRNDELVTLARGSELLIAECSDGTETQKSTVHMSGAEAGTIARLAVVDRLLLTHCYPEHDRDATLAAARRAFPGKVGWAEQGIRVNVT